jgi:hypothetical protein
MSTATINRQPTRWARTALDIPSRKPLYRLFASINGFVLEALVFSHGSRRYGYAVLGASSDKLVGNRVKVTGIP